MNLIQKHKLLAVEQIIQIFVAITPSQMSVHSLLKIISVRNHLAHGKTVSQAKRRTGK